MDKIAKKHPNEVHKHPIPDDNIVFEEGVKIVQTNEDGLEGANEALMSQIDENWTWTKTAIPDNWQVGEDWILLAMVLFTKISYFFELTPFLLGHLNSKNTSWNEMVVRSLHLLFYKQMRNLKSNNSFVFLLNH